MIGGDEENVKFDMNNVGELCIPCSNVFPVCTSVPMGKRQREEEANILSNNLAQECSLSVYLLRDKKYKRPGS